MEMERQLSKPSSPARTMEKTYLSACNFPRLTQPPCRRQQVSVDLQRRKDLRGRVDGEIICLAQSIPPLYEPNEYSDSGWAESAVPGLCSSCLCRILTWDLGDVLSYLSPLGHFAEVIVDGALTVPISKWHPPALDAVVATSRLGILSAVFLPVPLPGILTGY